MSLSMSAPPMKRGWMRKQSRSGMIKNWQKRYFVLYNGKISYYQEQTDRFPYGENLKGEMVLTDATVVLDSKKYSDKQIFISAAKGEKDMLVEVDTTQEVRDWSDAIKQHINFATQFGLSDTGGDRTKSTASMISTSGDRVSSSDATATSSRADSQEDDRPLSSSGAEYVITPKPAWVIKVLRGNTEKIFVNLCEHNDIPFTPVTLSLGYNKWPFMILTPARTIVEEKDDGGEITVYDAVVNPQVVAHCHKDAQAKDATCLRVMRLLKKNYGEDLQPEYKLPKINKRYKGEIAGIRVPQNISQLARTRSSIHVTLAPEGGSGKSGRTNSSGSGGGSGRTESGDLTSVDKYGSNRSGSVAMYDGEDDGGQSSPPSSSARPVSVAAGMAYSPPHHEPRTMSAATATLAALNAQGRTLPRRASEGVSGGERDSLSGGTGSSSMSKLFANVNESNGGGRRLSGIAMPPRANTETPFAGGAGSLRKSIVRSSSLNPGRSTSSASTAGTVEGEAVSLAYATNAAPGHSTLLGQSPHGGSNKRLAVPYTIVRSSGVIAKVIPDKAATGKVVGGGARVFAVARRVMPDSMPWVKTNDGWIMERIAVGSNQRVLVPQPHGQPIGVKVVSTRLEESDDGSNLRASYTGRSTFRASQSGWMGFRASAIKETFQTRFVIDIFYHDNAVVRLSRMLGDILGLRRELVEQSGDKVLKDRALKAGEIPVQEDGDEAFVTDVHWLLEVVESAETWLGNLLTSVQIDRCKVKALTEFLAPNDRDCELMDVELMAMGGMAGAWDVEEQEQSQ